MDTIENEETLNLIFLGPHIPIQASATGSSLSLYSFEETMPTFSDLCESSFELDIDPLKLCPESERG